MEEDGLCNIIAKPVFFSCLGNRDCQSADTGH